MEDKEIMLEHKAKKVTVVFLEREGDKEVFGNISARCSRSSIFTCVCYYFKQMNVKMNNMRSQKRFIGPLSQCCCWQTIYSQGYHKPISQFISGAFVHFQNLEVIKSTQFSDIFRLICLIWIFVFDVAGEFHFKFSYLIKFHDSQN